MVVHELATVNLILSSTKTMWRFNDIRQLQQPLFQSINHIPNRFADFFQIVLLRASLCMSSMVAET